MKKLLLEFEDTTALFNLKDGKKVKKLFYLGDGWTKPGAMSCSLKNTGNGLVFKSFNIDGTVRAKHLIEYCDIEELIALYKQFGFIAKSTVIE